MQYLDGLMIRDPDDVRTVMLAFFIPSEPLRLLSGFAGNLKENVSLLAAMLFWPNESLNEVCVEWSAGASGGLLHCADNLPIFTNMFIHSVWGKGARLIFRHHVLYSVPINYQQFNC